MSIRRVAEVGHSILRASAHDVQLDMLGSPALSALVDDMTDTMRDYEGVGIAAPQVYEASRLFLIEVRDVDRYRDATPFPLLTAINPTVTLLDSAEKVGWEGCLSIPELRFQVRRASTVHLDAVDLSGQAFSVTLEGFPAIVAQHEADHLDGVLCIDRALPKSFATTREYLRARASEQAPTNSE